MDFFIPNGYQHSCLSLNSWKEATTTGSCKDMLLEEGISAQSH